MPDLRIVSAFPKSFTISSSLMVDPGFLALEIRGFLNPSIISKSAET
jgi:hypothetical protein